MANQKLGNLGNLGNIIPSFRCCHIAKAENPKKNGEKFEQNFRDFRHFRGSRVFDLSLIT